MDTTTLDFNTLTLLVAILGSTLTTVSLMFRQFNHLDKKLDRLDTKFDTKIDALDTKFDTKFDALDTKFTSEVRAVHGEFKIVRREISVVGERLARVEGHLMGPESFGMRGPRPPEADEAPAEDPGPDHRQAG